MNKFEERKLAQFYQAPVTRMALPYVCFTCRKCFHRSVAYPELPEFLACPECGDDTVRVSPDFKAPRRSETAQWRKVEMLVGGGYRFYRYGSPGKGMRDARAFLAGWKAAREPYGKFLSVVERCEQNRRRKALEPQYFPGSPDL